MAESLPAELRKAANGPRRKQKRRSRSSEAKWDLTSCDILKVRGAYELPSSDRRPQPLAPPLTKLSLRVKGCIVVEDQ